MHDSDAVNACDGMYELKKAFKGIDDVITSMQEWSMTSE